MTRLVVFLNGLANRTADVLLAPIAAWPGWLSATLVAVATGALMLLVFKYTSNQRAIRRVRDRIKADLLALSLFKDSMAVSLRCQGRVFTGAVRLLGLAVVPVLAMTVPMCLLLAQLALWYQARPLRVSEEAVLTMFLDDGPAEMPEARLLPTPAVETTVGPVRVPSKRMVCWDLRANEPGSHCLTFEVGGERIEKQLAVGDRFMRVSPRRPGWSWSDALLYPEEMPLGHGSPVWAIEIAYPCRDGWASGTGTWLVYWFVVSMAAAFCLRPWLRVHI